MFSGSNFTVLEPSDPIVFWQHVGCDRVLGSETTEDKCRVCAGDGSSCTTLDGHFTEPLHGLEDSVFTFN